MLTLCVFSLVFVSLFFPFFSCFSRRKIHAPNIITTFFKLFSFKLLTIDILDNTQKYELLTTNFCY